MPILLIAVLFVSCAKPPEEEMQAAEAAVTRAENDPDAVAYAENTLLLARTALINMRSEAEAKRYDQAKIFAQEAINAAEKAIRDGQTAATRAKTEAANAIAALKTALADTERAITGAKNASPALVLDLTALDDDFSAASRQSDQAEVSASAGRYSEAQDTARRARSTLADINTRISTASIAVSRKK
jgi:PBP1b-binding outer membrane lipoprotein LpoB